MYLQVIQFNLDQVNCSDYSLGKDYTQYMGILNRDTLPLGLLLSLIAAAAKSLQLCLTL